MLVVSSCLSCFIRCYILVSVTLDDFRCLRGGKKIKELIVWHLDCALFLVKRWKGVRMC